MFLAKLTPTEVDELDSAWWFWARDKQLPPPGNWRFWLILAGRGFGKTRTGAEWTREQVKKYPYVNLIGATADDARDIMIEGESGILAVCPPNERPAYLPSKRRLEWPNGAKSLIFTADEPERLRGKQHMKLWSDELCAWRYTESWTQAMLGLRLGDNPQACITTTPKPTKILKDLMAHPKTVIVTGTTYENRANLAPDFYLDIVSQYEGTRLGRQELEAEILGDVEGALWTRDLLEKSNARIAPQLTRIVIAVDPAVTSGDDSDETGIIVAGVGDNGHGYILEDLSQRASPDKWASVVVDAYQRYRADRIVAEVNNGGDLVETVIRTVSRNVSYKSVRASKGKYTRAEPVAALYEQGKVHHMGIFSRLEDQLCTWVPGESSPDRLDALVWAITDLMLARSRGGRME